MKTFSALTRAVTGALLVAVLSLSANSVSASDEVRIGVDFNVLGSQVWVAQDQGFFQTHGVEADIRPFAFGVDTIDATLTGQLDFGIGLDFATTTRLQTGQLKIIAAVIEPEAGFHRLAVSDAIQAPEDLAGKKIGIAKGTAQHLVTIGYLQNFGVDVDGVELVPMPSLLEMVASLRARRIDAAFVWGDGVEQAEQIPHARILSDDKPANVRLHGYLVTTKDFAAENPDAVKNTLAALADATDWIETNFDAAVDIVASHARSPRQTVAAQMQRQNFTLSLKETQAAGFDVIAEFAEVNDITDRLIRPRDYIDASFLRAVAPERVTLDQ